MTFPKALSRRTTFVYVRKERGLTSILVKHVDLAVWLALQHSVTLAMPNNTLSHSTPLKLTANAMIRETGSKDRQKYAFAAIDTLKIRMKLASSVERSALSVLEGITVQLATLPSRESIQSPMMDVAYA